MTTIEIRLAELGVTLPGAPAPAANHLPYVRTGNQVRGVCVGIVAVFENA